MDELVEGHGSVEFDEGDVVAHFVLAITAETNKSMMEKVSMMTILNCQRFTL